MRAAIGWMSVIVLFVTGCAHPTKLPSADSQTSASTLTKEEADRLKEVAWDAAHSADVIGRFDLKRSTDAPMKLKKEGIECYVDRQTKDKVEVAIPDAGHPDFFHGHYLGVTVDRRTYEVLTMRESFWQ